MDLQLLTQGSDVSWLRRRLETGQHSYLLVQQRLHNRSVMGSLRVSCIIAG